MAETLRPPLVAARWLLRDAWRSVPSPLVALLSAVLLLGLTWTLVVPAFQAPDEQSHFGYVQSLVEGPGLPGDPVRPMFSTEQLGAQDAVNSDQTAANPAVKPTWSGDEWGRWQRVGGHLPSKARTNGGGVNPAASNPPLFYVYDAIPYVATSSGNLFARVTAMRLASILWLLVTVAGAWLLAGEVFTRDRLLQLVTAGVAGLLPMVMFVSAQIGPDTLLYALWSVALWLGVRIVKRGVTSASAAALLAVTGVAIVTKSTSYALLPGAICALAIGLWHIRADRPRAARTAALAMAALAVPVLAWFAVAHALNHAVAAQVSSSSAPGGTNYRELLSYVWQYYLPRLPFMTSFGSDGGLPPAYDIWVKQGWGAFGWLEVRFPSWLYKLLAFVTAGVAVAAVARIATTWRRTSLAAAVFLALTALALLAGLHWTDYHQMRSGTAFMQGRYVFPLVAIVGLAVAQALRWLPAGGRRLGGGLVLGALFVLQLVSLSLVLTRFYA